MFRHILCTLLMVLATTASGGALSPETDSLSASPDVTRFVVEPQPSNEPTVLSGGSKRFTRKQKSQIKQENAQANEGKNHCEQCRVETVPAKKHEKDVTPPLNETHVDHRIPSAKGGPSEVDNGQVLCRDCNLKKGDKVPPGK
ncbi:HNH endonuclease [Archangium violaceum]|uniref:HNH endonuclease n=1 Tax=Archangium violaceum TaxID=83451 RepID=UPI001950911B|nr:HNH endonuclease signature motif containing protein [Archangium violaceum]QRO01033.1 HNH endonuclease [Archangium violaceum]